MKKYYYTKFKRGNNDSIFVVYGDYEIDILEGLILYSNIMPEWVNSYYRLYRPDRRTVEYYDTLEELAAVHISEIL